MSRDLTDACKTLAAIRAFDLSTGVVATYDGAAANSLGKIRDELVGKDWETALGKFLRMAMPVYLAYSFGAAERVTGARGATQKPFSLFELVTSWDVQKALLAVFAVYFTATLVIIWRNAASRRATRAGKSQAAIAGSSCERALVFALTEERRQPHNQDAQRSVDEAVAVCKRVLSGAEV